MRQGRIAEEQQVIRQMIQLYCRKKEGHAMLCDSCRELLEYATRRLEHCHYGAAKPTCRKCPIHCYRPDMQARIQAVMRWAGPRMLFHHPLAAVKHLLREL
ncbi:nitrous oxide-stimulated promoter family protein [uncultured Porphyromonas sp.]|uniref:nitrous oxide-stimulated promoter family protein n=1 Tax=Porphyromonas sp. TaxID=1924944 RepID=UPI00262A51F7|nr:nitrous oxide-stimulated promoter family protein [uncultured Porphyromonas sp.]